MDPDRLGKAIVSLVRLVAQLRGPDGCPWDAQQTDSTIKNYLLEEAYEVLEAVENSSPQEVCQELGDLLFQILFMAQLFSERQEFDFTRVVENITAKMIRRHPHVFGGEKAADARDVAFNWERIKREEREESKAPPTLLHSVPVNLPALLRAHRLSERASKVSFDWADTEEIWTKVQEEFEELSEAIRKGVRGPVLEEMGDLLFSIVNLARHCGANAEDLLRQANGKFLKRFERMERTLRARGIGLDEATSDQMNEAWDEVKDNEGS
jgi:MazG family protein